jgi:chaperonin GroES
MKLRPLDDRVVISPLEEASVTKGGIVIPDAAKEKPTRGTVVAVGPGRLLKDGTRAPVQVQPKDLVWYSKYAGADVEVEGVKFKVIAETEILAKEV